MYAYTQRRRVTRVLRSSAVHIVQGRISLLIPIIGCANTCTVVPLLKDILFRVDTLCRKRHKSWQQMLWMHVMLPFSKGHLSDVAGIICQEGCVSVYHPGSPYINLVGIPACCIFMLLLHVHVSTENKSIFCCKQSLFSGWLLVSRGSG